MNYYSDSGAVFPTVATVIGFTPDSQSGPLVATLACPPAVIADITSEQVPLVHPQSPHPMKLDQPQQLHNTIDTNDPVTRAVVNNIYGNLPTKKPQPRLVCDICKIQVTCQSIMEEHLAGAKHARKVKSIELLKELQPLFNFPNHCVDVKSSEYSCQPCNVIVNSLQQLQIHCQGAKHKNKVQNSNCENSPIINCKSDTQQKGDALSSRFYCSTCNVRVNSDTQLEQHKLSKRHTGKVDGIPDQNSRSAPYFKNQRKVFVKEGWTGNTPPPTPFPEGGGGSLRCNVCRINANSSIQLQQHNLSKKHLEKQGQMSSESEEQRITTQSVVSTPKPMPAFLQAQPFVKKQWISPQNDINPPYSYPAPPANGRGSSAPAPYNVNVFPKWSAPTFQRSQHGNHGGYHRY